MRYVAAYALACLGGNKSPSLNDIEKILGSVGIEVDKELAKKVISEMNGKDVNTIIEKGQSKLASMPAGAAVVAAGGTGAAPAAGGGAAAAAAKEEPKKEEKKEDSDESDDDMGFGLFD